MSNSASTTDPQRLQTLINERLRDREGGPGSGRDKTAVLDDIVTELRAIRRAVEGDAGVVTGVGDDAGVTSAASEAEPADAAEDTTDTAER